MGKSNFTDIDGFNSRRRRERPGLYGAVVAGLLGAALCAIWVTGSAVFSVISPW